MLRNKWGCSCLQLCLGIFSSGLSSSPHPALCPQHGGSSRLDVIYLQTLVAFPTCSHSILGIILFSFGLSFHPEAKSHVLLIDQDPSHIPIGVGGWNWPHPDDMEWGWERGVFPRELLCLTDKHTSVNDSLLSINSLVDNTGSWTLMPISHFLLQSTVFPIIYGRPQREAYMYSQTCPYLFLFRAHAGVYKE
jgi:hypothetical protein